MVDLKIRLSFFIVSLLTLVSCIPEMPEEVILRVRPQSKLWTNSTFKKIYHFQDKLLTDSLIPYLSDGDTTWRVQAAKAFSSIKDAKAIEFLCPLLKDTVMEVRFAAAYSLGQIGDIAAENCLVDAFDPSSNEGEMLKLNGIILEALGKCGSDRIMKYLSSISTYLPGDTALLMGQVLGLYRFGMRSMHSDEGTKRMVSMTINNQYPHEVRLMSAHYLARTRNLVLDTFKNDLIPSFQREKSAEIRMVLATILGRINRLEAENALLGGFNLESDDRVKISVIGPGQYFRASAIAYSGISSAHSEISAI
jgi:HEAT repeat protein